LTDVRESEEAIPEVRSMPFTDGIYHSIMVSMRLSLDKAGRIVLPKPLRDELHLEAGDELEIESSGEDITLRPVRGQAQLRKKHGVWVYNAGERLSAGTVNDTIRQIRRERDVHNLGDES
jgi:AbrB family looped-hinge helix DNA binding protein